MTHITKKATTPHRYTLSVGLLIFIFIMLVIASLHFQSQSDLEKSLKEHLALDTMVLEQNPSALATYKASNKIVFVESAALAPSLKMDGSIKKLSKDALKTLQWDAKGITPDMLIATAQLPSGTVVIAERVNNGEFRIFLAKSLFYLLFVIIAIMLVYGFIINAHAMRRIRTIDRTARHIINGNLQKRIPINPHVDDEFSNLSTTLNQMLDTIEKLMRDLRQVNNNIAHDLKTPLNRLRSRIEIALLQARSVDEYTDVLVQSISDIDELLDTFNALLLMGNLESNVRNYQLQTENVSHILEELGEFYSALAEDKQHQLTTDIEDSVYVNINRKLFSQAISNLLDNAIKYTPNGGTIELALQTHGHLAHIIIADNGLGIPKQERERVFERFTRLDQSRGQPGTGLGMALVKAIVGIHHASIQLHDNHPGLCAEIKIPTVMGKTAPRK